MRAAVTNLKGGTAKTTTAVYLAAGFARQGRTLLVDADPQGSALSWSEAAGGFDFPVISLPVRDLHRRLSDLGRDYAHLIVDTPPANLGIVRSALLAVELALVPMSPTTVDLDRLRPTLEALAEVEPLNPIRVRVLLCRVRAGTRSATLSRQVLAGDFGLPLLEASVPLRETFGLSFGTVPDELGEYGQVLAELVGAA